MRSKSNSSAVQKSTRVVYQSSNVESAGISKLNVRPSGSRTINRFEASMSRLNAMGGLRRPSESPAVPIIVNSPIESVAVDSIVAEGSEEAAGFGAGKNSIGWIASRFNLRMNMGRRVTPGWLR